MKEFKIHFENLYSGGKDLSTIIRGLKLLWSNSITWETSVWTNSQIIRIRFQKQRISSINLLKSLISKENTNQLCILYKYN